MRCFASFHFELYLTPSQWVLLFHPSLTSLYDHQKRFPYHLPSDGCIDVNKPGWVLVTLEAALGEAVPWSVDHCEGTIMSSGTQPGSSEDPGACALLTARGNIVHISVNFVYNICEVIQCRIGNIFFGLLSVIAHILDKGANLLLVKSRGLLSCVCHLARLLHHPLPGSKEHVHSTTTLTASIRGANRQVWWWWCRWASWWRRRWSSCWCLRQRNVYSTGLVTMMHTDEGF